MHPIRHVDSSAFNRAAIGSSSSSAPSARRQTSGAAGEAVSARRRGAPSQQQQREQEAADDDDWFASRDKANAASGGNSKYKKSRTGPAREKEVVKSDYVGRGRFSKMNRERVSAREGAYALAASGGSSRGNGGGSNQSADRRQRSPPPHQSNAGGSHQKVHIHFPEASRDRYRDSPSSNRSSSSRNGRDNDERRGGPGSLDYGGSSRNDLASRISDRPSGGGRSSGTPSRGGGGGGGGGGRGRSAPAYNGSYF